MAAQPKRKKHEKKKRGVHRSTEDRRGDAITVAWIVCTLATAGALVIAGVAYALARPTPAADTPAAPNPVAGLLPLMLFISAVTSLVLLCLTPLVYLFRRVPPPKLITAVVLTVALLPWAALGVLAMMTT